METSKIPTLSCLTISITPSDPGFVRDSVDYFESYRPESPPAIPKLLASCHTAFQDLEDPNYWDFPNVWNRKLNAEIFGFDFSELFLPWLEAEIPAWPGDRKPITPSRSLDKWENVYCRQEIGLPVLAFICTGGIFVAVDHSVAGKDGIPPSRLVVIEFNPRVVGFFTIEVEDDSKFSLGDIPKQVKSGTAADVANWLVKKFSSQNKEGLSEILIAGWDKMGPSLYWLGRDRKLHQGVLFASGSCSEYGYCTVGGRNFPYMTIDAAVKLARLAIPTAVATAKFYSGSDFSSDEAGEIGAFVEVHRLGPGGYTSPNADEEVVDTTNADEKVVDTIREAGGT